MCTSCLPPKLGISQELLGVRGGRGGCAAGAVRRGGPPWGRGWTAPALRFASVGFHRRRRPGIRSTSDRFVAEQAADGERRGMTTEDATV